MSRITLNQFADALSHDFDELQNRMAQDRVLNRDGRPYKTYIDKGLFAVVTLRQSHFTPFLTPKGQIWLARKYPVGIPLRAAN